MTSVTMFTLTAVAAIGSGLIGGIFFAFSTFVMAALRRLPAAQGIAAMQSINVAVLNPWFLGPFFGTAAVGAVLAVMALLRSGRGDAWLLAGGALYIVGTVAVTILFNVPRNRALAAVAPHGADGARLWADYAISWTAWNHVRTAASVAASAAFIAAL
ncbi:MAG TPA: anthrone oxygenase family protein [Alphaproteobacteria bacterium]|nr:anthrone oxygenase family protein [Alphaproteobacteria bacterium]